MILLSLDAGAVYNSPDGTLTVRGFVDNATYLRKDVGLSKQRVQGQLEFDKIFKPRGIFSELSITGTFRASYDAVYDMNDGDFGKNAGGSLSFPALGNPEFLASLPGAPPFAPDISTNPEYAGIVAPPFFTGAVPLPATGGTINSPDNPNDGLRFAAEDIYRYQDGGVVLATPVRPCDTDSRGCLKDYMDKDLDDLRFKEFNDDLDFIRELYLNATIPLNQGRQELALRIGRQQVVWGRTDLFRVLDVVNPIDFSRQNLYAEFEDSRIPQGMINAEYRFGATKFFEDLNFQLLYKFEEFRPHDLGQGGEAYAILGAGNLFRALGNCWDNGCTVWNFPEPQLAVDFPAGVIGIRDVNIPDHSEVGGRIEGVFKGVGFSLNALYFYSQFPSLRGGVDAINPFLPPGANPLDPQPYDYLIGFDVEFPRLFMVGGSVDWYLEWAKASFRVETSYTMDEEFPDTLQPRLFSESDVFRWVFGFDRPTFIPFLHKTRAFLISGQIFGEHILDHETATVNSFGLPTIGGNEVGFQHHEDNIFLTLLIQGNYMNDRLTPQILMAYDTEAEAGVIGPSLEYKPNNNWVIRLAFNLKWADDHRQDWKADDDRTANVFPPATCGPALGSPICDPVGGNLPVWSSLGLAGLEPLGRFRAGPIGTAHNEDEFQFSIRYQF
jgi:hypothetical protein